MNDTTSPVNVTVKIRAVSFWKAVIGTCSGTAIFPVLLFQPLWRTLFHMILITLLSTVAVMIGAYITDKPEITEVGKALEARFGNIHISDKGIIPTKIPTVQERHFAVTDQLWLDYYPEKSEYSYTVEGKDPAAMSPMGIQWDPQMILFWIRTGSGYYVMPIVTPREWDPIKNKYAPEEATLAGVRARTQNLVVKATQENDSRYFTPVAMMPTLKMDAQSVPFSEIVNQIFNIGYIGGQIGVMHTFSLLFVLGMICFFFAVSSWLFMAEPMRKKLSFFKILNITVYAAFPGVLIGTVWTIFNLSPWGIDGFQITIFALLGYSFAVNLSIQRFLNPPQKNPKSRYQDPEDDL